MNVFNWIDINVNNWWLTKLRTDTILIDQKESIILTNKGKQVLCFDWDNKRKLQDEYSNIRHAKLEIIYGKEPANEIKYPIENFKYIVVNKSIPNLRKVYKIHSNKDSVYVIEIKLSRGEKYIADYLDSCGITYEIQKPLFKLDGDNKKYRVADFYLNKLGIYIEYNGLYDESKAMKEEYKLKTQLYFSNNLPLVILVPSELGIIDYALHTKISKLFTYEKFTKKGGLLWRKKIRYKLMRLSNTKFFSYILLWILFFALVKNVDFFNDKSDSFINFIGGIITLGVIILPYSILRLAYLYLVKNIQYQEDDI